jgi:23S rRNA (uracil1939-C5)-methyltransferase
MAELVEITGIASGGAGVGRLQDGRVVFVHRTAPGDRVRVQLIEDKKTWTRAALVEILTAAPGRREPPCRYYDRCGGCTLEHLTYESQLAVKAQLVHDALTRIGKLQVDVPTVIASPQELRYRNRVSFTLLRLAKRVVAGFHEIDRPGRVMDIGPECLLPEPVLADAWGELRRSWGGPQASLLPSGPKLRLTLRASGTGDVSLVVEGGYSAGRPEELLAAARSIKSVWHRPRPDGALTLLAGQAAIQESWQDEELDVSGSVFLQVNRAAAELLEEYVLQTAGNVAGQKIVDGYCGIGLHARRLARMGASVTGIELDPLAIEEARAAHVENTNYVCGRVEDELPAQLPADLVILNPPRAGVDESALASLNATTAPRLIYISCNPATLARDLGRMRDRYRLASIRCFDLFPQTAHVETVVELRCVTL